MQFKEGTLRVPAQKRVPYVRARAWEAFADRRGSENDEALQNEEAAGLRPQNSGGALDTRRWTCPKCKADQAIAVGQAEVRCERCHG